MLARLEGKIDLTNATLAFMTAEVTKQDARIHALETAGFVTWKSVTLIVGAIGAVGTALAPFLTQLYGS